ncbi:MAG: DNA double-strand break repair ATPase Rad50 [Halobacteriales archaeon]|nr:DNA double-strand break repair ATPase Rad50 [Halobacteriales archaeon]
MRFTRVRLEQFKCFDQADVGLDRGVTVIHGLNGSGKSSLLQACFFALYGSRALDGTLEEIITNGEDETVVELWFNHAGTDYQIRRRIRRTDDRAQTAECVLDTGDDTIEGAREVRRYVSDLLRMDDEAFVNCAYVRQGEVNKLINATPQSRQAMLDDLLQLGTLEEYRERASQARLGVEDVLENRRGNLEQLETQIDAKEDKDLQATLSSLQSDLADVEAEIERFEANREQAEATLEEAEEIIETHREKQSEIEELRADIEELREAISETERERDDIQAEIEDHRDTCEELREERATLLAETDLDTTDEAAVDDRIEELESREAELDSRLQERQIELTERTNEAETLREQAADLETEAEELRETIADLEADIEDDETELADRRDRIDDLEAEIEDHRGAFDDAPIAFGEAEDYRAELEEQLAELQDQRTDLRTELETTRNEIEQAEALLDAGKCPECGQPVDDSPHVESLDADRERLEELADELDELDAEIDTLQDRIETAESLREAERTVEQLESNLASVEELLAEKESTIEDKRDRVGELRTEVETLTEEAEIKRADADDIETTVGELREEIADIDAQRAELTDAIGRLEELQELSDAIADREAEIERLEERHTLLGERNDDRRSTLQEKRDRRNELAEAVDEDRLETARDDKERATEYLENVEEKLTALNDRRDTLQSRIGGVENELEELASLRDRREDLEERVEALESLHEEADRLESMYGDLRAELRQRNIASLERLLNEVFDLVYQNDAYARIELDANYELTVYQKDGEALDPEQLSGGERALFNLSLRTAIYRLIAEGIEGSAPMPPLILDEPTVFLDSGHVSQLIELVESMRDLGVEQIIVVSHDTELVGAADDLITVEKDATTNRSRIEREQDTEIELPA